MNVDDAIALVSPWANVSVSIPERGLYWVLRTRFEIPSPTRRDAFDVTSRCRRVAHALLDWPLRGQLNRALDYKLAYLADWERARELRLQVGRTGPRVEIGWSPEGEFLPQYTTEDKRAVSLLWACLTSLDQCPEEMILLDALVDATGLPLRLADEDTRRLSWLEQRQGRKAISREAQHLLQLLKGRTAKDRGNMHRVELPGREATRVRGWAGVFRLCREYARAMGVSS